MAVASLTACGQTKNDIIGNEQAIQNIKLVFNDYVKYQESTDSQDDKNSMINSLESIYKVTNIDELDILISVWMYYDPTDFPGISEIDRILKNSRPLSIEAVKRRITNKKDWESEESAPYSDLKDLLKRLEDE